MSPRLSLIVQLLVLLTLQGCDPITPRAALRHQAYSRLGACLNYSGDVKLCLEDNAQWCREHGLENTCGADEFWPRRR